MSADDRREVIRLINEWNSSRYELFALSQPNEDAGEKVSTKCIRVDSTASTDDVIKVLIEKFRPDMKSLSSAKDYAIYEVHADSQERKLDANERPLWIQLDWGKDGREGRFLLKNENAKTVQFDTTGDGLGLLRDKKRMSKREKKKQQKQLKESAKENKINVAEHLYKEVPDSNFTRSISNPEIVMARRRQQKLENKLKQIKNKDGGGTLKVYGETLKPDIPYKTLLMSNQDTAAFAVKETLEKYGLPNEEPDNYCLVQVVTPTREEREKHGAQIKEYILEDNACPLAILMKHPANGSTIIFQIRRCTPDILAIRKAKKKAAEVEKQHQQQQQLIQQQQLQHQQQQQQQHQQSQMNGIQMPANSKPQTTSRIVNGNAINHTYPNDEALNDISNSNSVGLGKCPCLIELTQEGFELQSAKIIHIRSDFYEMGNDKYMAASQPNNYIRLDSNIPGIEKKHCVLKRSNEGMQLFIIPLAETYINDRLIKEPTQLHNNFTIRLGKSCLFRLEFNASNGCEQMSLNNEQQQQQSQPQHTNQINNLSKPNSLSLNHNNNWPQMNGKTEMNGIHNTNKLIQSPAANTPTPIQTIPPNYGTLYDNGQFAASEPQPQPLTSGQQPLQMQPTVSSSQLNGNSKPSEGLPGLLEFPDDGEDALLSNICSANQLNYQFKLAPVYTMYMMLRFRLSQKYKSELSFNEKLQSSALLIHKMVNFIREAVDTNHSDKQILPFWLANSSELLYFLKQDIHLSQVSYDAQELLADCVQITFKYLVNIMQQQLDYVLIAFFDPSDHVEEMNGNSSQQQTDTDPTGSQHDTNSLDSLSRPTLKHVIQVLNETMNLLRGSRVNAALTIQLFSQLFHYISVWMFNKLISDQRSGLCSRYWGAKLTRRLNKIQQWAEKQGLELAADCHLSRIIQAAFFLQASKQDNIQDLPTISSQCFALNSLQLKCLLGNYVIGVSEPPLSAQLCNNLISIAQNTADEVVKQEGRNLQLHEEVDLQLPFLLPEDGHSCDIIKGLPACLLDFLEILQNSGHCWLWQNTQGPGSWKKFMIKEQQNQLQQPTLSGSSSGSSSSSHINNNINNNINNMTTIVAQPHTRPAMHSHSDLQNGVNTNQKPQPSSLPVNVQPQQMPPPPTVIAVTTPTTASKHHMSSDEAGLASGPTVVKLKLSKKNNGLGLSIVAARGVNQINSGIYVKSVVPGGAADDDGRLDAGDQLLAVDEASLINVTQERAAELMCKSGPVVVLTVAKEAAYFHDLDALLNKSPLPPVAAQMNKQQHMSMTSSMPLLNNINGNGMIPGQQQNSSALISQQHQQQQQQTQQAQFSSVTLPRNHLQQQQQQLQQQTQQTPINKLNGFVQQQPQIQNNFNTLAHQHQQLHQNQMDSAAAHMQPPSHQSSGNQSNGYRVRSMSQEILRSNGNPNHHFQQQPTSNGFISQPMNATPITNGNGTSATLSPLNKVQPRQSNSNHQVTSPIRALPNEHMRYGSERPVSMHAQQYHFNNQTNGNGLSNGSHHPTASHLSQRNLPNEFGPRYGSERPASALASQYFVNNQNNNNQHGLSAVQRLSSQSSNSDLVTSPVRQPTSNGNGNGLANKFRQASLSELDEINYNNLHVSQAEQQQAKLDELYGRVNPNRQSATHINLYPQNNGDANFNSNNKQSRTNSLQEPVVMSDEQQQQQQQQRAIMNTNNTNNKMAGQLYEQIWANNQQNNNNNSSTSNGNHSTAQRLIQQASAYNQQHRNGSGPIDDLNNFKNLEITNGFQHQKFINQDSIDATNIRNKPPPSANLISSVSRSNMMNGNGHQAQFDLTQNKQPRNYENQIINHQQQQQQQQRQFIAKPAIPSKPFNLNILNNTEEPLPPPPIQSVLANAATAKLINHNNQNQNGNGCMNNKWEHEQMNRLREDEETRLDLLRQRMDLLHSLESKPNRTNDEENKLNKLHTEIEFDKRVIEMNNQNLNGYMQDNEETETDDYSPDVRERLASQMLKDEFAQRRRKLEELNGSGSGHEHEGGGSLFHAQKIDKRFVQFENTQNEIKREEFRFKNQQFNGRSTNGMNGAQNANHFVSENSSTNLQRNGFHSSHGNGQHQFNDDSNHSDEQTTSNQSSSNQRPQKHVQFMNETEIMSPKYSSNSSMNLNVKTTPPDQKPHPPQDNNNITTPPQQQKRVMFSDTSKFLEFDRVEDNTQMQQQHTPCVIGANEIYVDQRLKQKQQQQQQQQMANMFVEGEKLSFKDKMKLFAMQSGESLAENADNKFKVSKKQREIESKFEIK